MLCSISSLESSFQCKFFAADELLRHCGATFSRLLAAFALSGLAFGVGPLALTACWSRIL